MLRRPFARTIDFTSLEYDRNDPFYNGVTHRRRWLMTTSFAGLAAGAVIGTVLYLTFGIESLEAPAVASQQRASLWQRSAAGLKTDRMMPLDDARRQALARLIHEKPYKRIAGTVAPGPRRRAPLLAGNGLAGSLAPDYPARSHEKDGELQLAMLPAGGEITGSVGSDASIGKPTVLPPTGVRPGADVSASLPRPGLVEETVKLRHGDTLFRILTEQGTRRQHAQRLIAELESLFPTRYLKDGHEISVTYETVTDELGRESRKPVRLAMAAGPSRTIVIEEDESGRFRGYDSWDAQREAGEVRKSARIRKSLYLAAKEQGIPDPVIIEMMRIHAYDVDFQRDVHEGDTFEVFYAPDKDSKSRRRGVVLYSALTLGEETRAYYRFVAPDSGIVDYYDAQGRSATKILMRTPLKAVRITSSFGMRRHPLLGYTKMHTGVDFGATYGTPVKAAGSGIIEKIGRYGAYGKYVRIRHLNGYKTAYAHMSGFATGLSDGSRVRQGQVIGYVGSTGRSTGPHLHYEILVKNKPVNPMTVKLPKGRQLKGKLLKAFLQEKAHIDKLRRSAPVTTHVAARKEPIGRGGP